MNILIYLTVFIVAMIVGLRIVTKIPSLLHTPLMSGIMALSGVNIIGAIVAAAVAVQTSSKILGAIAIIFCTVNVVGGFYVTERMLRMFKHKTG